MTERKKDRQRENTKKTDNGHYSSNNQNLIYLLLTAFYCMNSTCMVETTWPQNQLDYPRVAQANYSFSLSFLLYQSLVAAYASL